MARGTVLRAVTRTSFSRLPRPTNAISIGPRVNELADLSLAEAAGAHDRHARLQDRSNHRRRLALAHDADHLLPDARAHAPTRADERRNKIAPVGDAAPDVVARRPVNTNGRDFAALPKVFLTARPRSPRIYFD